MRVEHLQAVTRKSCRSTGNGRSLLGFVATLSASLALATACRAEIVIEGRVALPPARAATANLRYQKIAGEVAPPEPPSAIVYLETSIPDATSVRRDRVELAQKGYQFAPGLLAVQAGQQVVFPNRDDEYHHVFSYSKTKSFDLGRYRKDEDPPAVTFDEPGVVTVGCEIHDHMRGTILVLETPYFVKTGAGGDYRLVIPEPLSGAFRLKAWVSQKQVFEKSVELRDGVTVKADFLED